MQALNEERSCAVPNTLSLTFCYSALSDWQKKSWCDVADGRDHTSCCRQRQVLEICYGLCVHNTPGPLDPAYLACMQDTAKIVMCYQEGLGK